MLEYVYPLCLYFSIAMVSFVYFSAPFVLRIKRQLSESPTRVPSKRFRMNPPTRLMSCHAKIGLNESKPVPIAEALRMTMERKKIHELRYGRTEYDRFDESHNLDPHRLSYTYERYSSLALPRFRPLIMTSGCTSWYFCSLAWLTTAYLKNRTHTLSCTWSGRFKVGRTIKFFRVPPSSTRSSSQSSMFLN